LSKNFSLNKSTLVHSKFITYRFGNYKRLNFINLSFSKFSFLINSNYAVQSYNLTKLMYLLKRIGTVLKHSRTAIKKNSISLPKKKGPFFVMRKLYKILYFRFIKVLALAYTNRPANFVKSSSKDVDLRSDRFVFNAISKRNSLPIIVSYTNNFKLRNLVSGRKIRSYGRRNKRKIRNALTFFKKVKRIRRFRLKFIAPTLQAMYWFRDVQYKGLMNRLYKAKTVGKIIYLMRPYVKAFLERKARKRRYLLSKKYKFKVRYPRRHSLNRAVMNFRTGIRDKVYRDRNYKTKGKVFFKDATIR